MLWKVAHCPINRPIWSHWLARTPLMQLIRNKRVALNIFLNSWGHRQLNFFRHGCESWTVWPDLPKFGHTGEVLKVFGNFLEGLFCICAKYRTYSSKFLMLLGRQIFILVSGQKLNRSFNHLVTLAVSYVHQYLNWLTRGPTSFLASFY